MAALLCPELETQSSSDLADKSWDKALEVFHYNHVQSHAIHEALETLKIFRGQALKFTAAQGSLSATLTDVRH